jgi:alanine dehydrogenase
MKIGIPLADLGLDAAMRQLPDLRHGLNTHAGAVTHRAVAEAHALPFVAPRF